MNIVNSLFSAFFFCMMIQVTLFVVIRSLIPSKCKAFDSLLFKQKNGLRLLELVH